MSIKTNFKLSEEGLEDVEATLTITMTMKDWEKLHKIMGELPNDPAYYLKRHIKEMVILFHQNMKKTYEIANFGEVKTKEVS